MSVLMCKQYINRCYCMKQIPNANVVFKEFIHIHSYEFYYAKIKEKLGKHKKKWSPLFPDSDLVNTDIVTNDDFINEYIENM